MSRQSQQKAELDNRHFTWQSWSQQHFLAWQYAWRQLLKTPFAAFATVLVIAVVLALPSALFILLQNANQLTHYWDKGSHISVYLKLDVPPETAQSLQVELQRRADIKQVTYITPAQGLQSLEAAAGFGDVLQHLEKNPLPALLIVEPHLDGPMAANSLTALLSNLRNLPEVDAAKMDLQWLQRLKAIITLLSRIVDGLSFFLILAVLLIIGNTLRLTMGTYRADIEVLRLIGATPAYIRRPFLYAGALYGLIGAILALLFIRIGLSYLQAPVDTLAHLYQSQFLLSGLSGSHIVGLCATGIVLGYIGARLAVAGHLKAVDRVET